MNTLNSLFDWMLGAGLRASVLVLVVLAAQWFFKNQLPSRWRYALWLPVLAALLVPALPLLPTWVKWPTAKSPTVEIATAPVLLAQPAAEIALPRTFADAAAAPAVQAVAVSAAAPVAQSVNWRAWLVGAWLCGAVGAGLFVAASFAWSLRRIRRGARAVDGELLARIAQTAKSVGLRHAPRVLQSPTVGSPAVCGLLRPTLLLNADFPAALSEDEADMVLRHELTHIRRGDLAMNALLCGLLALHWWNPLLWLAFARARADREAACDADVLRDEAGPRRAAYGRTLLKMETSCTPSGLCLGFVGILQRGGALRERIHSIIAQPQLSLFMKTNVALIILAVAVLGLAKAAETPKDENMSEGSPAKQMAELQTTVNSLPELRAKLEIESDKVAQRGDNMSLRMSADVVTKGLLPPLIELEAAHRRMSQEEASKLVKRDMEAVGRDVETKYPDGGTMEFLDRAHAVAGHVIRRINWLVSQMMAKQKGFDVLDWRKRWEVAGKQGEAEKSAVSGEKKAPSGATAAVEDLAFFVEEYTNPFKGVKPLDEYADPDEFYSEIAKVVGIPKFAQAAVAKKYGWADADGTISKAIVKRVPTLWQVAVMRFKIDPKTGKPDAKSVEIKSVHVNDRYAATFPPDEPSASPASSAGAKISVPGAVEHQHQATAQPSAPAPGAAATEDVAFFEKKYATKIEGVKPIGDYDDPDTFYSEIARRLGIPKLAQAAAAEEFGWGSGDGKSSRAVVKRAPGQWQVMVVRFPKKSAGGKPDIESFVTRMVILDDAGKATFPPEPGHEPSPVPLFPKKTVKQGADLGRHQPVTLATLEGGAYNFTVTHIAKRPEVRLPSDPIPDNAFDKTNAKPASTLTFSDDLREVTLSNHPATAVLKSQTETKRIYRLSKGVEQLPGTPPELSFTQTDAGVLVQLTHFGSGVPIIESYRGTLNRK